MNRTSLRQTWARQCFTCESNCKGIELAYLRILSGALAEARLLRLNGRSRCLAAAWALFAKTFTEHERPRKELAFLFLTNPCHRSSSLLVLADALADICIHLLLGNSLAISSNVLIRTLVGSTTARLDDIRSCHRDTGGRCTP